MDESSTTLYLVRHGATPANEQQPAILQGCGVNNGLSTRGREQAQQVGEFLATLPLDAVFCGPLLRAVETAEAIATRRGLGVETVDAIHEVNVGRFERLDWGQIEHDFPEEYRRFREDPVNVGYPDGESLQGVQQRIVPAFESLLQANVGRTIAVVAHSVVNRVYLSTLLGLDLTQIRSVPQENCCVNVIEFRDSKAKLRSLNVTFHLK